MGGSYKRDHMGTYGEKNDLSPDYIPSGRYNTIVWYDNSTRTAWLFGGVMSIGMWS